jgi:hypothetical protein
MRLVYEISASDTQLRRVLRGVEQEARASSRRMAREQVAALQGPGRKEAGQARRYDESQARASARAAESLDRQRSRSVQANYRQEERAKIQADRNAARSAEQLDRQRHSGLMAQYREEQAAQARAHAQRERTVRSIGSGAARSIGGGIGTVARVGGAALALAGGFGVAEALHDRIAVTRKASILANQSEDPGAKGAIVKEAQSNRGFTGEESLDFLTNFHEKSGDLGAARGAMKDMAQLALATGTDLSELGFAAGSAFTVIRDQIKDPQKRLETLRDVMTSVAQQGSMGAIEMRNLVDGMSELGGATRSFQGGPARLLTSMGGLAQVALQRGGAGSAEEAVTSVARFATDIPEHAKEFAKQGIGIYADKGHTQLRAPEQILGDMLAKTGGDLGKMGDLFGVRAQKVARGFSPLFGLAERQNAALPASQRQKTGVAGRAAVLAEFEKFAGATRSQAELHEQAASRLNDPDLQIKEATKAFNNAIGTQLLPVLTQAIPKFVEMIPAITKLTEGAAKAGEYLLENPYKGIGLIIAGSVAKDIAAAGLGSLLEKLLVSAFAGQAASSVAGGAASAAGGLATGAAGAAGGIGLALGGAIAAAVAGTAAAGYEGYQLTQQSGGLSGVGAGIGGVLAGRGYAGGVDDYMNEQARQQAWTPAAGRSWFDQDPAGRGGAAGGQNPAAASKSMADQVKQLFGSPTTDLAKAAKELSSAAKALKDTGGNRDPRSAPIKPG